MDKEPFLYKYSRPVSDWFEEVTVNLKPNDYHYFRIERRFGPSWWLIGMNPKEKPKYHWEYKEIGEIYESTLQRFIEWAKYERGSKIIEVKSLGGDFDIIEEMKKLCFKAEGHQSTESA